MRRIVRLSAGALGVTALAFCVSTATADSVDWNAVAQCESGGNWAANTGNGAYGGLQIKDATWDANGGQTNLPSQASPQQQIAVGQRILATQGPGAWPTCMSRGRSRAPEAMPVGSVTQFLSTLIDDAASFGR